MKQNRIKLAAQMLVFLTFFLMFFIQTAAAKKNKPYMVEKISIENGYFLNDFDPDVYYYDVIMSSLTNDVSVSVELTEPRFKYEISGDDEITEFSDSENIVTVSVYDTLGEYDTAEYHLNIYIGDAAGSVWTGLSYLDVKNGNFSPQFSRYKITYYAILENNIKSFDEADVNYRTVNADAAIEIKCLDELNSDGTLKEGRRTEYELKVTESNGKSKTYYLNLYRKAYVTASLRDTATLSNIKINGDAVDVGFSQYKTYYDLTVPKSVKNLDIQAYPADKNDIVQVIGAEEMNESQPVFVNILVTPPSEDTYGIYTLRLSYANLFTPKFSVFQLVVCILLLGSVLFAIGFFAACCLCERRMHFDTEVMLEVAEEIEDAGN